MRKLFFISCVSFLLIAASCERCYNCKCETYTEINGQVVDTNITEISVCGTDKDLQPYEDEGCLCLAK